MTVSDPYTTPKFESSALVVIDVQRDFLDDGPAPIAGTRAVLDRLRHILDAYRVAGRLIVHAIRLYEGDDVDLVRRKAIADDGTDVVRPGSIGASIPAELLPDGASVDTTELLGGRFVKVGENETVMFKPRWSAFHRTTLDEHLRALGVDTVVFAGCNFPNCPRASIFDASERDYRVAVISDATSQATPDRLADARSIGVVDVASDAVVTELAQYTSRT